jgi:hypothetical protein
MCVGEYDPWRMCVKVCVGEDDPWRTCEGLLSTVCVLGRMCVKVY